MSLDTKTMGLLIEAVRHLEAGFKHLPEQAADIEQDRLRSVLLETAERMRDNYPYHHPFYAGQMLKPPHPVARLSYALAMFLNPNNHALDGGRASSEMEKEAVAGIAQMFGWQTHLGHLCGGGTMANMEALWVAGLIHPDKKIVASQQAHYTHSRLSGVLKLPFESIACNSRAGMDVEALESVLKHGRVGTVVVTMGTTATGSVDPLPEVLALREKYNFRIHADAAYGGYFTLADNLDEPARRAFDRMGEVDSIVVDPHKHGLQPYGCGCVLFRDPSAGRFYRHDSPYTYFSSSELHLGEITLECSRAGASAVALWATMRLLPLLPGKEFARGLEEGRKAGLALAEKIRADSRFLFSFSPDLDIVVWAPAADKASEVSSYSKRIFEAAQDLNLHLAVASFPGSMFVKSWDIEWDQDQVSCLRSCLMKPQHLEWMDQIWALLDEAVESAGI